MTQEQEQKNNEQVVSPAETEAQSQKAETPENIAKDNVISDKGADSVDILYYVGCTASFDDNVREVGINTVNILNALGLKFGILGKEEECCGSVLLRVGDKEFFRLAEDNVRIFNSLGVKMLITSCAGCFRTIKEDYKKVGKLNMEVLHTAELMARLIREKKIDLKHEVPLRVTYHDPCHLGRHSNVYDAPREVMKAIPGLDFVEMDRVREMSRCCGAGGGLKAGFGDLQNMMAQERVRDAEKVKATRLVSTCPFCYQGLQVGIHAIGSGVKMTDLTELVALSMGIEATS